MRTLTEHEWNEIQRAILRCLGDHRLCPNCYESYIPNDRAHQRLAVVYDKFFNKEGT